MLIGIDVGGTFTDGVCFEGNLVQTTVKRPTDSSDLKGTLLTVLDQLLASTSVEQLERIVISTTLVTNLLAQGEGEPTALVLLPGPGLPLEVYNMFPQTYFLRGSVDFRGRTTAEIDQNEITKTIQAIEAVGISKVAVVGKFSNRNNSQEKQVRELILGQSPAMSVAIGSETAGQLNFLRRIVTTYYTIMTQAVWDNFIDEIEAALQERDIKCEVDVLKADGGTMPLTVSRGKPCETVFSGPAASTMGAVALTQESINSVVIDIGGTTADISLLIDGQPLYASKGANIQGHYTHINAFSLCSVPLGGDSPVLIENQRVDIGPRRFGPAACFGGEGPTVTDVFNLKYQLGIGNSELSAAKLDGLAAAKGLEPAVIIDTAEEIVVDRLQAAIKAMFREWEEEPAYRVWEVVNSRKFNAQQIIGIGAAAAPIIPALAQRMEINHTIPPYAEVANALGACVARPTLSMKVHIDTQNGYYTADQDGISDKIAVGRSFQLSDARELARTNLTSLARARGMEDYADEAEIYLEEQFNVIRGWNTAGKIFDIGIQISPGFIKEYQGVKR